MRILGKVNILLVFCVKLVMFCDLTTHQPYPVRHTRTVPTEFCTKISPTFQTTLEVDSSYSIVKFASNK